jgi:hypothetical protein
VTTCDESGPQAATCPVKLKGKLINWPDDAEAPCSLVSSELSARRTLSGKGVIRFVELRTGMPVIHVAQWAGWRCGERERGEGATAGEEHRIGNKPFSCQATPNHVPLPYPCAYRVGPRSEPSEHHNKLNPLFSTRDNSTTMDPISIAIAELEPQEPGAQLGYRVCAERWGVNRETLRRRHQGLQDTRAGASQQQQNLSPQQEKGPVQYIEEITKQALPPTRTLIQNFASAVAKFLVLTC